MTDTASVDEKKCKDQNNSACVEEESKAADAYEPNKKRQKVLEFEELYLEKLPSVEYYEKSYMHRDIITHCIATKTEFLITASCDGRLKFWKKIKDTLEFVKDFRTHHQAIVHLTADSMGKLLATISLDKYAKIFDVVNFDMINIIKLDFVPGYAEWIYSTGEAVSTIAISDADSPNIKIYDALGKNDLLHVIEKMHRNAVVAMKFNPIFNCTVSADKAGILEYWQGVKFDFKFPKNIRFESKLDTDLFEFVKAKTYPTAICFTPDGKKFATISVDRKIRIFVFLTGKLSLVLDETIPRFVEAQQAQKEQKSQHQIPSIEFNKKMATEKDLDKSDSMKYINILFDESGYFILYPTMLGIKMVNIFNNKCVKIFGKMEHLRPLHMSLLQNKWSLNAEKETSKNYSGNQLYEPFLFCTGYKKNRFYYYSRRQPSDDITQEGSERDVFNEKPTKEDIIVSTEGLSVQKLYENAIIHTSLGDIHVKLFSKECPKTIENFCGHSKSGYYNGHIFHRVIKSFMIQTGDPSGNGTGGHSIWGGEFEDEFSPNLKHDKPYTLSMANAGPNTNGSQFFITVIPTPWLDNKHTVFGRVQKGMEVVQNISNVRTHPKNDKPYEEISIISITLK